MNRFYAPVGFRNAKVGSKVEFDMQEGEGDKGPCAAEVHGLGGAN